MSRIKSLTILTAMFALVAQPFLPIDIPYALATSLQASVNTDVDIITADIQEPSQHDISLGEADKNDFKDIANNDKETKLLNTTTEFEKLTLLKVDDQISVDNTPNYQLTFRGSVYRDDKLNDCYGKSSCEDKQEKLSDWTVNLYDSNWELMDEKTTDNAGMFSFTARPEAGDYHVCLSSRINDGWNQSPQTWSGGGHMVNTEANNTAENMPYCATRTFANTNNFSTTANIGVVDTQRPTVELLNDFGSEGVISANTIEVSTKDNYRLNNVTLSIRNSKGALVKSCSQSLNSQFKDEHTLSCDISELENGSYSLKTNATDLRGKTDDKQTTGLSDTLSRSFVIDRTAPKATVKSNKNHTATYDGSVYNTISFKLEDNYKVAGYYVNEKYFPLTPDKWSDADHIKVGSHHKAVEGEENILKVVDLAGNESAPYTFYLDSTPPQVEISEAYQKKKGKIEFTGHIYDKNLAYYYCYLSSPSGKEIESTRDENCITTWAHGLKRNNNPETTATTGTEKDALIGGFDIRDVPEGEYYINLTAVDRANNISQISTKKVTVDHTKPKIKASLDNTTIGINDQDPTLTIDAKDNTNGVGISYSQYKIMYSNGETAKGWVTIPEGADSMQVNLDELSDGNYTLRARTFDKAHNKKSGADVEFVIDKTSPKVESFTFSNKGRNLTQDNVVVTMITSEPIETPAGWEQVSGKANEFTIEHDQSGKYNVSITDLAGNTTTSIKYEVKRIDRNAPVISGVANGSIVQGPVTLTISDPKYGGWDGFNAATGLRINNSPAPTEYIGGPNKEYAYILNGDGVYNIVATDKAGNETTLTFEIDNTNPTFSKNTYRYDSETKILSGELSEAVQSATVHLYLDGTHVDTVETELFDNNTRWNTTALNSLDAGDYTFTLIGEDLAGNEILYQEVDSDFASFTVLEDQKIEDNLTDEQEEKSETTEGENPSQTTTDQESTLQNSPQATNRPARPAELTPLSTGSLSTPQADNLLAFTDTTTADTTVTQNDSSDDDSEVLGATTENNDSSSDKGGEVLGASTEEDGSANFFGMAWYWWTLILVAVASIFLLFLSGRKRIQEL